MFWLIICLRCSLESNPEEIGRAAASAAPWDQQRRPSFPDEYQGLLHAGMIRWTSPEAEEKEIDHPSRPSSKKSSSSVNFTLVFSNFLLVFFCFSAEETFHLIIRNPGVPKCSSEKVIVTSGFQESEQDWRAIKSRKFGRDCQWRGLGGVFWGTGCGCERIGVRVEVV